MRLNPTPPPTSRIQNAFLYGLLGELGLHVWILSELFHVLWRLTSSFHVLHMYRKMFKFCINAQRLIFLQSLVL